MANIIYTGRTPVKVPVWHIAQKWRLSEEVVGPRGGKSWKVLGEVIPEKEGQVFKIDLKVGWRYKINTWFHDNPSPDVLYFTVDKWGRITPEE